MFEGDGRAWAQRTGLPVTSKSEKLQVLGLLRVTCKGVQKKLEPSNYIQSLFYHFSTSLVLFEQAQHTCKVLFLVLFIYARNQGQVLTVKEGLGECDTSQCHTTMENGDDTVLIAEGVVQGGLSSGFQLWDRVDSGMNFSAIIHPLCAS